MDDAVQGSSELFIDGERCAAADGRTYPLYNPARPAECVGHAAAAGHADVDRAFAAAQRAYPGWAALSYAERAHYLLKVADHLMADADELRRRIRLFTREHGKILRETELELTRLDVRFRFVASYADRLAEDEKLAGPPFDTIVTRQPRGVAALIVPWNWPLSILGAKLPQALMAGNTVVVKPSANAAMVPAQTIARVAEMLPPGVVNVVTGSAGEIGDQILTHEHVRMINFTGSVGVGQHVMTLAARRLTPVTLELGGNDAAIVLEDAVLDTPALERMYAGAFMTAGQICMALKRLYVHHSRYDEVVEGLSAIAARQVVGDGLLPETTMGPLNNPKQKQTVSAMIAQAREAGADVKTFGIVPDEDLFEQGHFIRPTLVFNPDQSLDVVQQEQFGPVLPIMPIADAEEGVRLANASRFGLCSSVWTADPDRAVALARRLEAGYTYLNGHGPVAQDNRAPFGGFKDSGIGRNIGYEGVLGFQAYHSISGPEGWIF